MYMRMSLIIGIDMLFRLRMYVCLYVCMSVYMYECMHVNVPEGTNATGHQGSDAPVPLSPMCFEGPNGPQ